MEVKITADSQAEFDQKREALAKALAGKHPITPRQGFFAYQNVMLAKINRSYLKHMQEAKKEIDLIFKKHKIGR